MYLVKDPPYENLIHFDQTWQSKLWNDEKKKKKLRCNHNNQISFRISISMEHKHPL